MRLLRESLPTLHRLNRSQTLKKTGTGSDLRGAGPAFVPASNEPPQISPHQLKAAGRSVFNSFQDVKDQLSLSGFGFGNPGEPTMKNPRILRPPDPYLLKTTLQKLRLGPRGFLRLPPKNQLHKITTYFKFCQ